MEGRFFENDCPGGTDAKKCIDNAFIAGFDQDIGK